MSRYEYVRDGAAIYARSFATIRAEADLSAFSSAEARIVVRVIHAGGMVEVARDMRFAHGFPERARQALLDGKPILCDSRMVAHGITRARSGEQFIERLSRHQCLTNCAPRLQGGA